MSKVILIIDGNYLLYKDLFILKKDKKLEDLPDLLFDDFKKIISNYSFQEVFFVSDSTTTWRKLLYKDYKGNRIKDNDIDWDYIFDVYSKFKNKIRQYKNIRFLQQNNIEGDDFIAKIIRDYNSKCISTITVSNDSDLHQLLKMDLDNKFINIIWNYRHSDERLYLPQNYQLFLNTISNLDCINLFNANIDNGFGDFILNLINRCKIVETNPEESLFVKIITGDKGDNIKSVIKLKDKVLNEEGRGIGKDGAKKIYEYYKKMNNDEIVNFYSDDFINELTNIIMFNKKVTDDNIREHVRNNLKFNIKLIKLDDINIPIDVLKKLDEYYSYIKNKSQDDLEILTFSKEYKEEDIIPEKFNNNESSSDFSLDDFFNI